MARSRSVPRLLQLFVISVVANAVLGIWALLSGDFGDTQRKILGTSFLVSAAMLSVLVNVPAARRRALWPAPSVGAITGSSGFALFVVFVWTEPGDDFWFKLAGSLLVVAAAASVASSLSLIALPAPFGWLQPVGTVLITLLGITVIVGLWAEPDTGWYARLLGIEAVLVAAMTLLIPVLARFSPSGPRGTGREIGSAGPAAIRFCPSCGRPVEHSPLGSVTPTSCEVCGLTFEVQPVPDVDTHPAHVDDGAQ